MEKPPSAWIIAPVTKSYACEARNTAAPAISSGSPNRPADADSGIPRAAFLRRVISLRVSEEKGPHDRKNCGREIVRCAIWVVLGNLRISAMLSLSDQEAAHY